MSTRKQYIVNAWASEQARPTALLGRQGHPPPVRRRLVDGGGAVDKWVTVNGRPAGPGSVLRMEARMFDGQILPTPQSPCGRYTAKERDQMSEKYEFLEVPRVGDDQPYYSVSGHRRPEKWTPVEESLSDVPQDWALFNKK